MNAPRILDRHTLNRTLLGRQGLLERTSRAVEAVLTDLVGMQAQEPGDPYVGLWTRIADFDPLTLSTAIETRRAVRIGLMRTTLHLVTAEDALAIAPVTREVHRRTFRNTPFARSLIGVDERAVVAAAQAALEAEPLTPAALGAHLATHWPEAEASSLAYLARYSLDLVQVPPRGLWRQTGRATNTTLAAWTGRPEQPADVANLVIRYLRAFGPATVGDIRTWSGLTGLREVVEPLRPRLRTFRDERGRELLDVEDGLIVDPGQEAPVRFLPQYDNVFLSHEDRSRIDGAMPWGLDFGWKGAILVDGRISGAWRVRQEGKPPVATMRIELGRPLTRPERADLEDEADRLARFLDPDRPAAIAVVDAP